MGPKSVKFGGIRVSPCIWSRNYKLLKLFNPKFDDIFSPIFHRGEKRMIKGKVFSISCDLRFVENNF